MLHARATSDARNRPKTALGPPPRHVRRPPAEHSRADLARNRFAPHPTTPTSCKSPARRAPEDVRVARGLKEALAQCPAKERAKGQQRGGANGAGQGGNHAAAKSGLTRVRGVPSVLRGWCGLYGRGCAAMRVPYSLPHFYTYRLTCISSMTTGRMDITLVCRGGASCPPRYRWEHSSREPKRPATAAARAL